MCHKQTNKQTNKKRNRNQSYNKKKTNHYKFLRKLGTRKQELEKKRMLQVNAERISLQRTAEQLLDEGADAVSELAQPVQKCKRYLPVQREQEELDLLKGHLAEMPCLKNGPGKTQLCSNYEVYINSGKLAIARLKYKSKPKSLHRALLKLLLPEKILKLDGISRSGKRSCVGINPEINESVTLYVATLFKNCGGDVNKIDYDPDQIMKNLLDNTKRTKGRWRHLESTSHQTSQPSSSSLPSKSSSNLSSSLSSQPSVSSAHSIFQSSSLSSQPSVSSAPSIFQSSSLSSQLSSKQPFSSQPFSQPSSQSAVSSVPSISQSSSSSLPCPLTSSPPRIPSLNDSSSDSFSSAPHSPHVTTPDHTYTNSSLSLLDISFNRPSLEITLPYTKF